MLAIKECVIEHTCGVVGMHYQELQPSGGNVDDENVYEGQQQNLLMNVEEVRQLQAMAEENSGDESGEDYQQESDRESRRSRASSRSVQGQARGIWTYHLKKAKYHEGPLFLRPNCGQTSRHT